MQTRAAARRETKSAAWMMLRMQLFHALARHVRVDLRGGEIAVSEQHLHHAQVGAMVEQVRRESVAQRVRRQLLLHTRLTRVALDDVPEGLARHLVAAARREQEVGLPLEQDFEARALYELLQPAYGLLAERDQALAVALAD